MRRTAKKLTEDNKYTNYQRKGLVVNIKYIILNTNTENFIQNTGYIFKFKF